MALIIKPAFVNVRIGFNGSAAPLGQRSQEDLKLFLILSYTANRADYVNYYVSPPTLDELLGNAPGTGNGAPGTNGWSWVPALEMDGDRVVIKVADWQGGTGVKPAAGGYVGAAGIVQTKAAAMDVRGLPELGGGGAGALNIEQLMSFLSNDGQIVFTQVGNTYRADMNIVLDGPDGLITYAAYASLLARVQGLEAGTGITSFVELDFTGSTGIELTAPGAKTWHAKPGGSPSAYGNVGVALQSIPAGHDGVFGITQHETGVTGDYYLGLSATTTESSPYLFLVVAWAVDKASGVLYRNQSTSLGITLNDGDWVGLQRIAGAVKLVTSSDAGTTWTVAFDWQIVDNSELYIMADLIGESGLFKDPKNTA